MSYTLTELYVNCKECDDYKNNSESSTTLFDALVLDEAHIVKGSV